MRARRRGDRAFGARDRAPAPKRAVGATAVELLLRRLRSGSALPVHHVELLPELKVRASCRAAPSG
ncbi:hypothetical protein [Microbispora catharanthi]|uniref:Substrate-binding domain-containing protein n=1 Tax=Microbispora catharanthi TaxID=1712871 RepID=A0A5N6C5G9_9ACTN|nr:hypothetical protein [Microbispora catharanthi]KAB8188031.1 hypothetical protein FH610_002570 [Microbispora catharanthi]